MERVKSLTLPNGRRLHVAEDHDHVEELRNILGDNGEFNITIHGSPEHISALKESKSHHYEMRNALRQKHPDIIAELENLQAQMDELSADLQNLTKHEVHLEANFGKFGYSANLRTHTRPKEEHGATSTTIRFWKRPVIRQYFHKGLLWRAHENEEVASCELFVDLLYVGVLHLNGERASEHPSANAFLSFCITMIPSYKIWSDLQTIVSWFETDDIVQRAAVLFVLACLFALTTNIFLVRSVTYAQFVGYYITARLFAAFLYIWGAYLLPMVKATLYGNALVILVPVAVWIGSIYVDEPNRMALIWIAIFLDLAMPSIILMGLRGVPGIPKRLNEKIKGLFDFYPALNIEHKTERTNQFVSLVFGYSVVAILYQNASDFGLNAYLGKAMLGLTQAYCFNTIYFDIDGSWHELHAIRRKVWSAFVWINSHLVFVLAFSIYSAGLSKFVMAHDLPTLDVHDLYHHYESRSFEHLDDSLRWFYCGGLAVSLLSMTLIAISHLHKDIGTQRLSKKYRLAYRVFVAAVWLCLPAAGDRLNSLTLLAITTGMTLSVVALEVYGISCMGDSMFGAKKTCPYICDAQLRRESDSSLETAVDPERQDSKSEYILKDNYIEVH